MIFIESMRSRTLSCITFLIVAFLFATPSSAQDAMLTKEETVNYLNKKAQEVDGRDKTFWDGREVYKNISLKLVKSLVELSWETERVHKNGCEKGFRKVKYIFDPAHLLLDAGNRPTAIYSSKEDIVYEFEFKFRPKTVRRYDYATSLDCRGYRGSSGYDRFTDVSHVSIPFFAATPENRTKMERAMSHLRDLAKAEDDPFGN
jgi:hypothetical protein